MSFISARDTAFIADELEKHWHYTEKEEAACRSCRLAKQLRVSEPRLSADPQMVARVAAYLPMQLEGILVDANWEAIATGVLDAAQNYKSKIPS